MIVCRCIHQCSSYQHRVRHDARSSCKHYAERRRRDLLWDWTQYCQRYATSTGTGSSGCSAPKSLRAHWSLNALCIRWKRNAGDSETATSRTHFLVLMHPGAVQANGNTQTAAYFQALQPQQQAQDAQGPAAAAESYVTQALAQLQAQQGLPVTQMGEHTP